MQICFHLVPLWRGVFEALFHKNTSQIVSMLYNTRQYSVYRSPATHRVLATD